MKTYVVPIACAAALTLASVNPAATSSHTDSAATATDAVIDSAIFVASLPITATSGSIHSSAEALVLRPARDTFLRPLGDLDYDRKGTWLKFQVGCHTTGPSLGPAQRVGKWVKT